MWRRFTAAAISAALVLVLFGVFAFADTPQTTVAMRGQATANSRTGQIRLVLNSGDARKWLLDMTIVQRSGGERERERERERGERRYSAAGINGSFTLSSGQTRLSSGTVTGSLNQDGTGYVSLSDANSSTFLELSFGIGPNGAVAAAVQGQFPVIGPAASAPTTPNPTPASLPAQQPVNHFYWYLSRTSGIAAFVLLFINVCLGIGLKSKYLDQLLGRWRAFDLHQFTALLAGALIVLHVFSLLGDAYFSFSLSDLFVPMASTYRPFWTAIGIIGFYAGAIVALSAYLRRRIGEKPWRILHYSSYVLFFIILFHSIKGGTDRSMVWVQWLYVSTGAIVAFLFFWRVFGYRAGECPRPVNAGHPSAEQSMPKVKPAYVSR